MSIVHHISFFQRLRPLPDSGPAQYAYLPGLFMNRDLHIARISIPTVLITK